ncbi:DUF6036 family nucleotidyltransferase [Bhargavaea cecembensis]|uniref:DUF6036 family nucleotidyltransferase n=1 Tax=Bhargavaea cecembensis TaxID=394098 RepID=UPI000693FF3F|nr:DUF6036 family nucleotidyltransferase [Bhargavaea cecembensis]
MISQEKIDRAIKELEGIQSYKEDNLAAMVKVAAVITSLMAPYHRVDAMPIIVGGLAVEIYTAGDYTTRDIDLVTSSSMTLRELLPKIGFDKAGRIFYHEQLEVAVDVVDSALEGSYDRLTEMKVGEDSIYIISIEDIILDRLRGSDHPDNDRWGLFLLSNNYEQADLDYIRNRVENKDEGLTLDRWVLMIEDQLDN